MADKKKSFDIKEVWPGIQRFLKGFPKNLKPMWKDPVNNMQQLEAKRKDVWDMMYTVLAILAITILLSVLGNLIKPLAAIAGIVSTLNIIPIAGLMFAGFLLFVLKKAEEKFKALTCKKCGHMLDLKTQADFAKYVTYEIRSEKSSTGISHPASKDGVVPYVEATGSVSSSVAVAFTCTECGENKAFMYYIEPLKLKARSNKVVVAGVETAKVNLTNSVQAILDMYENGDGAKIPYSISSVHHPRHAERTKPQTGYESYRGVDIVYHRDIDEMVEGLFIHNELNGTIKSE